ncbi:MAG: DUF6812 domain-containing protein [Planctomycetota bacterium]
MDSEESTAVVLYTDRFVIHGAVALVPGARLTDFLRDAPHFIAVSGVLIRDHAGEEVARLPFCDVRRDSIELAYLAADEAGL